MRIFSNVAMTAAATMLVAGAAMAQDTARTINDPAAGWFVLGEAQSHKTVADPTAKSGKAIEVSASGQGGIFAAGAIQGISGEIHKGDRIVVSADVRATAAAGAPAKLLLRVETAASPWKTIGEQAVEAGPQWSTQTLEFVAQEDHPAGSAQANIQMNSGKQTVFLGPVVVLNKGRAS